MKLAASNIAWDDLQDEKMYSLLQQLGFCGLEAAPTRLFPVDPYSHIQEAKDFRKKLQRLYGLQIVSLQSIWYGRQEHLFGSQEEWQALLKYTYQAIDFAAALGCANLVFGCPKNRILPENGTTAAAEEFFSLVGEYAKVRGTVFSLEANPPIYGTNFINSTDEAVAMVQKINQEGFRVNFDFGTVLANKESLDIVKENLQYIQHIHISEPWLAPVQITRQHEELAEILSRQKYAGFVSLEMKKPQDFSILQESLAKLTEVFYGNV